MIIDCHGHYTTAPELHNQWRIDQLAAFKAGKPSPAYPEISDQSIIDSGVGGRSISQQGDIEGKRAGCHGHGEPVVGTHHLDVDRIRLQSKIDVRHERVHRSQAVEAGHHDLGGRVLRSGQVGR